ncbi:MAG: type II toxin-antitoxin system PemK/MazF family toxin [Candidatus Paceibacterota bacterium]
MNIGYGQYFLVNFNPGSGHEYQGKRPAIVIESDKQLRKSNLVTVLPLTSNLDNKVEDDIVVRADASNRLKFDSVIKVFDIASFDRSRFINKIGEAEKGTLREIKGYLSKHFDLL